MQEEEEWEEFHIDVKKLVFGAWSINWSARCPVCDWSIEEGTSWMDNLDDVRDRIVGDVYISHSLTDCAATEDDIILDCDEPELTTGDTSDN
jgi:hypothetical protein